MVEVMAPYTVIILFSDFTEKCYECATLNIAFSFFDSVRETIKFQETFGRQGKPPHFESVRLRFNPYTLDLQYYPIRH